MNLKNIVWTEINVTKTKNVYSHLQANSKKCQTHRNRRRVLPEVGAMREMGRCWSKFRSLNYEVNMYLGSNVHSGI
jgi:hypothetical protein